MWLLKKIKIPFLKNEIILDIVEILFLIVFVFLPIRFFLIEPFFVKGDSMEPNFHSWDYLIIDKFSYFFQQPRRGDVIIFHPPFDNKVYYIKRIIGLPGETVVINGSDIFIYSQQYPQGFHLRESYLKDHYTFGNFRLSLKKDEYFVLGDNREVSYDSRKWGPLPRNRIIGKVMIHLSLINLARAIGFK